MTVTEPLTAFLKARLDEDEATAKAAAGGDPGGSTARTAKDVAVALHVGMHDPARVLREVEAKRAIVAEHEPDRVGKFGSEEAARCLVCLTDREGYEELWEADEWPCATLRTLAAVYRDHPDYRSEWKP